MREPLKRKPNRLENYDYHRNGAYFITVCARDRLELFATIDRTEPSHSHLELSDIGRMVEVAINRISQTYPDVCVDQYVIMPDHVHLILTITRCSRRQGLADVQSPVPTVQTVVGQMKRFVSMQCGFSVWQKSFHDHVIRNEEDYLQIAEYIETNPRRWKTSSRL